MLPAVLVAGVASVTPTRIGLGKDARAERFRKPWPSAVATGSGIEFINIKELFEKHADEEFLKFGRVTNKLSNRPDIHAFLLLDKLVPRDRDIVAGAAHDEIFLDVEPRELEGVATEEQIIELTRCGVRFDSNTDGLAMFV